MKSMKKSLLGAAVAAALGFAAPAQAGVVIDLFTDPAVGQAVSTIPGPGPTDLSFSESGSFPTIIGGYRDMKITKVDVNGNAIPQSSAVNGSSANVENGVLTVNNASGVYSNTSVTWDGQDNSASVNTLGLNGGTGVDLTFGGNANTFFATILLADQGFAYSIGVWDSDGDFSILSSAALFQVTTPIAATYSFDWFNFADNTGAPLPYTEAGLPFRIQRGGTGNGSMNFQQITALQLNLFSAGIGAADFQLGSIQTVPEPSALALAGLALIGAGLATRRRAVNKA